MKVTASIDLEEPSPDESQKVEELSDSDDSKRITNLRRIQTMTRLLRGRSKSGQQ